MLLFINLCSVLLIVVSILPLSRYAHWSVRVFDFPRVQKLVIAVILLVVYSVVGVNGATEIIMVTLLFVSMCYQVAWVFRYTFLSKVEVRRTEQVLSSQSLSILSANVLQTNRQFHRLLDVIKEYQPDVVVTLETDKRWDEQLLSLEKSYPFSVKVPQENFYGMHLFSRYPLQKTDIHYRIKNDVPSITTDIILTINGCLRPVKAYFLHPMPPSPTESPDSTSRDQELILVAKEIAEYPHPCVVAGDLNDVAWSKTTRLFRKVSTLLDPRIGRGAFNTFHASIPFFRWPLDHVFHSHHFTLNSIRRLPHIGSDHFPIYVSLQLQGIASETSEEKQEAALDLDEKALVDERMQSP